MTSAAAHVMCRDRHGYDVVVAGGGSAGVAAAIGAARAGARVALVEGNGFLGGAATASSVMAYCGSYGSGEQARLIVGRPGLSLLDAITAAGQSRTPTRSSSGHWYLPVNAELVKLLLDRMVLAEPGIDVLLHTQFVGCTTAGEKVESVLCRDAGGQFEISATGFVDTSGNAVLCAEAFAAAVWVPDPRRRQVATQVMRVAG